MENNNLDNMNIVIVGHVDHGKSTIIGRLLADTHSLPEGKLEQVKETCRRNAKPFEFAFLLDALKDEQAQGITIDAARVFFKTPKRKYIIIDAPGHIEFLKNMVTGAARAEAALLVIDANEGVMENSKRHGYLLSMLGIKQVVVLVNKMDLIAFNEKRYHEIVVEYEAFLSEIGVEADSFIPVSGFRGDNIAAASEQMAWYKGCTVLEKLDLLDNKKDEQNQVFRMPVQGVYKFTGGGDDRRIVAGTIDTGRIEVGDEVIFYPSGKKSKVKTIERFNAPQRDEDYAGSATSFTLEQQIYVTRGELACLTKETKPQVAARLKTKLFWLGKEDLNQNRSYFIKIGTQKVRAELEKVVTVLDASTLTQTTRQFVQRNEVAEVIFNLEKEAALDKAEDLTETSRFVLVDNCEISGGGIVVDTLTANENHSADRTITVVRDINRTVTKVERALKNAQKPVLILISGSDAIQNIELAGYLERGLFTEGRNVYYLKGQVIDTTNREISLAELAEKSNLLMDAGNIVITAVDNLRPQEINIINVLIEPQDFKLIGLGDLKNSGLPVNLLLAEKDSLETKYRQVKTMLASAKIIFEPCA